MLKSLLPVRSHGSCDEFGHIHFHAMYSLLQQQNSVWKSGSMIGDDDKDCHEGKSVFSYLLVQRYKFSFAKHVVIFDQLLNLKNGFISPDLDLPKKPPKSISFLV